MTAATNGHLPTVERLLGAGADVNAKNANGATALWARLGRATVMSWRALLSAGADASVSTRVTRGYAIKGGDAHGHGESSKCLRKQEPRNR